MAIRFRSNGGLMIENVAELWRMKLPGKQLFLDLETTSFNKKQGATNPWKGTWVLGVCVKTEETPAYYVPVNHVNEAYNVPLSELQKWLIEVVFTEERHWWVNHNIKYDAHVLHNAAGIKTEITMYDTLDLAKLLDSDRMRYGLDALSFDWLKEDINKYEHAFTPFLKDKKGNWVCKDYAYIPPDIVAEYGCQDVITNEKLWYYIIERMPESSKPLVEVSSQLVTAFLDIERQGMPIDLTACKIAEATALSKMVNSQTRLKEIVGYEVEPHKNADCFDVLCNHYGLPVLDWTEEGEDEDGEHAGNPSFNAKALKKYKALPDCPDEVIDCMLSFRRMKTFLSYFIEPWKILHDNGLLHGDYNQTVRTGRMSCRQPNMQQLMMEAKVLVVPPPGFTIISIDYSQIEFRVIGHYIRDENVIKSYNENPYTDFHNWVRDMCVVDRDSAKTSNFLMGYGGGQKKLISQLILVDTLVKDIWRLMNEDPQFGELPPETQKQKFTDAAIKRATEVYHTYHDTLPGIKRTSREAMNKAIEQGYVTGWFGRQRKLGRNFAHKAFNSLCQGTAADLLKERLVSLYWWLRFNNPEVKMLGAVHDECVLICPTELVTDELLDQCCFILEDVTRPFRIPIRTSAGVSDVNWYRAGKDDAPRLFDRELMRRTIPNYSQTFTRHWAKTVYQNENVE